MEEKRPVDIKRSRGGAADIGTNEEGAIKEMINIDDKLIVVKERALYEFMMADTIDPNRENADLPSNIQQLILSRGSEDPLVGSTFLTAKTLFSDMCLSDSVDGKKGIKLALELLKELSAMEVEISEYLVAEAAANAAYEERRKMPGSFALPSIPDVHSRCKTIFQRADHASQALMDIVRLFYPEFDSKWYFSQFATFVEEKYGAADTFTRFVKSMVPFLLLVRNIRNCLDHRKKQIQVRDYELRVNGDVVSPTMEMEDNGSKLERESLSSILPKVYEKLVVVSETMLPYLCSKHTKTGIFAGQVRQIPEDKRRYKHVQYSFWLPWGEGGYYGQ